MDSQPKTKSIKSNIYHRNLQSCCSNASTPQPDQQTGFHLKCENRSVIWLIRCDCVCVHYKLNYNKWNIFTMRSQCAIVCVAHKNSHLTAMSIFIYIKWQFQSNFFQSSFDFNASQCTKILKFQTRWSSAWLTVWQSSALWSVPFVSAISSIFTVKLNQIKMWNVFSVCLFQQLIN